MKKDTATGGEDKAVKAEKKPSDEMEKTIKMKEKSKERREKTGQGRGKGK